jgi:hypothetical protein
MASNDRGMMNMNMERICKKIKDSQVFLEK